MHKKHYYRVGSHSGTWDDLPTDPDELDSLTNSARKHIEPWLSAVFQAEHFNLLLGSGFTTAVGYIAGVGATGMAKVTFGTSYDAAIDAQSADPDYWKVWTLTEERRVDWDAISKVWMGVPPVQEPEE